MNTKDAHYYIHPKMSKWISVNDWLPEEGHNVLVFISNSRDEGYSIGYYTSGNWWGGIYRSNGCPEIDLFYPEGGQHFIDSSYVTHWMPLPESPK